MKKKYLNSHIQKTVIITFIAGCTSTLGNNIQIGKPASPEDALAYVSEWFDNSENL